MEALAECLAHHTQLEQIKQSEIKNVGLKGVSLKRERERENKSRERFRKLLGWYEKSRGVASAA